MKIFWMVGEVSGDLHASYVANGINNKIENAHQYGVGGPLMAKAGVKLFRDFNDINLMGFAEIIKHLTKLLKIEAEIKKEILRYSPDILILVDFPGMNMRLAKFAKKNNIRVLYYISPKFWAWKEKRIYSLKKYTDCVASIFPFETDILKNNNVKSVYVGNPIPEQIEYRLSKTEFAQKFSVLPSKKWIAFFPGSRTSEVTRLMPVYIETIKQLKKSYDIEILISQAMNQDLSRYKEVLNNLDVRIVEDFNYEIMQYSDFLIVKSGTTTLEAALINTPLVLVYKTNPISYWIATKLVKIKWIGLPNIIMNREVIPELIQEKANLENIYSLVEDAIQDRMRINRIKENIKGLRENIGTKRPSETVPNLITEIMNEEI